MSGADNLSTLRFDSQSWFDHDLKSTRNLSSATMSLTLFVMAVALCALKYANGLRVVSHRPGIRCAFSPLWLPGSVIPPCWWNPGLLFMWRGRFDLYRKYGSETISVVPFISGRNEFLTSNLDVARQVIAGGVKSDWVKPYAASKYLSKWGVSLLIAERDVWLRHRRIMTPAFSTNMYRLVWSRAIECYHDMVTHERWSSQDTVDIPDVESYTKKLALLVISACGFGITSTWSSPSTVKDEDGNESISVAEALRVEADMFIISFLTPAWVRQLPFNLTRLIKAAHNKLAKYMYSQVAERKEDVRTQLALGEEGERDIFSLLVRANEVEAQNSKLTLHDQELIGNVFLLLVAGHETTAHTLAATFALLAAHPDVQDDIYQEILDVIGPDGDPKFEDYYKLNKVLSAFYEASRMFPAVYIMPREATKDTELVVPNPPGTPGHTILAIPKGTWMTVDTVGLQYNPRHFPEPEKFKPSRWHADGENASDKVDAVTSFSIGPRTCIGRRFATTEAVAFLAMWLRDWSVEPLLKPGETDSMWRERVLQARLLLTLDIVDVPVRMRRRARP